MSEARRRARNAIATSLKSVADARTNTKRAVSNLASQGRVGIAELRQASHLAALVGSGPKRQRGEGGLEDGMRPQGPGEGGEPGDGGELSSCKGAKAGGCNDVGISARSDCQDVKEGNEIADLLMSWADDRREAFCASMSQREMGSLVASLSEDQLRELLKGLR